MSLSFVNEFNKRIRIYRLVYGSAFLFGLITLVSVIWFSIGNEFVRITKIASSDFDLALYGWFWFFIVPIILALTIYPFVMFVKYIRKKGMRILSIEFDAFQKAMEDKYGEGWRSEQWEDCDSLMYKNLKRKATLEKKKKDGKK